jgi:hypothetical protein
MKKDGMATYQDIQKWVRQSHGFVPQTCWIAHCKVLNGLPTRRAPNRQSTKRVEPCPADKRAAIEEAFRHFGLLP